MAKGRKTGGRDFQKGQKGGPGRPPVPDDIKAARALNTVEFERIANQYLYLSPYEIRLKLSDPSTTAIENAVGRIILQAITKGDQTRLQFFLDRLLGKVKEKHEHSGPDGAPITFAQLLLEFEGEGGGSGTSH